MKTNKRIRVAGISDTAVLKKEIQRLVREIVIKRDGGCIFRNVYTTPGCNGFRRDGEQITTSRPPHHPSEQRDLRRHATHRLRLQRPSRVEELAQKAI